MPGAATTLLLFLQRALLRTLRLPAAPAAVILLPVGALWLLSALLGALPARTGGFPTGSYLAFAVPAAALLGALLAGALAGADLLADRDSGFMEMALALPGGRAALLFGRAFAATAVGLLAALLLLLVALACGVRPGAGLGGVLAVAGTAALLCLCVAGLSSVLALAFRRREAVRLLAALLLTFSLVASDALLPRELLPGWVDVLGRINPFAYAVHAARAVVWPPAQWDRYAGNMAALGALALLALCLAALSMGGAADLGS